MAVKKAETQRMQTWLLRECALARSASTSIVARWVSVVHRPHSVSCMLKKQKGTRGAQSPGAVGTSVSAFFTLSAPCIRWGRGKKAEITSCDRMEA